MDNYHHGDLKQALLDIATDQLARAPLDRLSLRGLARAAGVSPSAAYHHFPSLDDLLAAIAERGFARLLAEWEPLELEAVALAYLRLYTGNPGLGDLLFGERLEAREELRSWRDRAFAVLAAKVGGPATGTGPAPTADGGEAVPPLFAWSLVHGLAGLFRNGAFGGACAAKGPPWDWSPEEAVRRLAPLLRAALHSAPG